MDRYFRLKSGCCVRQALIHVSLALSLSTARSLTLPFFVYSETGPVSPVQWTGRETFKLFSSEQDSIARWVSRYDYGNIYRESVDGQLTNQIDLSQFSNRLILPFRTRIVQGTTELSVDQNRFRFDFDRDGPEKITSGWNHRQYGLTGNYHLLDQHVRLGGRFQSFKAGDKWRTHSGFLISVSPLAGMAFGGVSSKYTHVLNFDFFHEDMKVSSFVFRTVYERLLFLSFSTIPGLEIDVLHSNGNLRTTEFDQNYEIAPDGQTDSKYYRISIFPWTSAGCEYSYNQFKSDEKDHFTYLNQKFGKLTTLSASAQNHQIKTIYCFGNSNSILAGFGWQRLEGDLRGHIETWPFTSAFIGIFGNRQHLKASGVFDLKQVNLGWTSHPDSHWFNTNLGVAFWRLKPSGEILTWRPAFLVFGIADLRHYQSIYRSVDGITVNCLFKVRLSHVDLGLRFAQVLPVSAKRIDREGEEVIPEYRQPVWERRNVSGGTIVGCELSFPLSLRPVARE